MRVIVNPWLLYETNTCESQGYPML